MRRGWSPLANSLIENENGIASGVIISLRYVFSVPFSVKALAVCHLLPFPAGEDVSGHLR